MGEYNDEYENSNLHLIPCGLKCDGLLTGDSAEVGLKFIALGDWEPLEVIVQFHLK